MLVTIKKTFPLVEREYDNRRTGQKDVFRSKAYILSDGLNSWYAEAIGTLAQTLEKNPLDEGQFISAELTFSVREYTDKDGVVRNNNEVTITRIAQLG